MRERELESVKALFSQSFVLCYFILVFIVISVIVNSLISISWLDINKENGKIEKSTLSAAIYHLLHMSVGMSRDSRAAFRAHS
jgi:hypothetical protein